MIAVLLSMKHEVCGPNDDVKHDVMMTSIILISILIHCATYYY